MARRLRSQKQEREEQILILDIFKDSFSPVYEDILRKAYGVQFKSMLDNGLIEEELIKRHRQALNEELKNNLNVVAETAIARQLNLFKKQARPHILYKAVDINPEQLVQVEEDTSASREKFASSIAALRSNEIAETTSKVVSKELENHYQRTMEDDMSEEDSLQEANDAFDRSTIARAAIIAETTSHNALTYGGLAVMLAVSSTTGDPTQKEWLAVFDEKTREDHVFANGQKVDVGDPFLVGGEQLQRPGDPNGSAGNIINCRCVVGYLI